MLLALILPGLLFLTPENRCDKVVTSKKSAGGWYLAEWLERLTANLEVDPRFDPSFLWHSGIWGAADEAVMNKVLKKSKKYPFNNKVRQTKEYCSCVKSPVSGKFLAKNKRCRNIERDIPSRQGVPTFFNQSEFAGYECEPIGRGVGLKKNEPYLRKSTL